jgi:hypothetical protein
MTFKKANAQGGGAQVLIKDRPSKAIERDVSTLVKSSNDIIDKLNFAMKFTGFPCQHLFFDSPPPPGN